MPVGFLDSAKQAAQNLKTQVDTSMASSQATKEVERHYRDLGMLAYLEATGRPVHQADRERLLAGLSELEAAGSMPAFQLQSSPPPPPGAAGPPPPPGQPHQQGQPIQQSQPGQAPPPPPPPGSFGSPPPPPPPPPPV